MRATHRPDPRPAHRHSAGHEHDFEPVHGLPEVPPAGEHILWQGSPDWRRLAVTVFHVRKAAVYFAAMLLLRAGFVLADGGGALELLRAWAWPLPLVLLGLGLLTLLAWLSARTTVYTLTNRRVVMRIGIVLTVAFNLPLSRITSADLRRGARGTGDIALALSGRGRIAWLHLWPHARPWRLAQTQPMLRSVPEAEAVAATLAQAWSAVSGVAVGALPTAPAGAEGDRPVAEVPQGGTLPSLNGWATS
jgi:hypothetical protein